MNSRIVRPLEIFAMKIPRRQNPLMLIRSIWIVGNERSLTDKGRPGDPPAPVENGPVIHPVFGSVIATVNNATSVGAHDTAGVHLEGVAVGAQLDEPVQVVAQRLGEQIQQVDRLFQQSEEDQNEHAESETDFAESPDAEIHAGKGGAGGNYCDAPHDYHLTKPAQINGVETVVKKIRHFRVC